MRRLVVLACLALVAPFAHAQTFEGIQVIGHGGRINVIVTSDSAWLDMLIEGGGSFRVRTDSATMATWADNAYLLAGPMGDTAKPTYAGAKLAYTDPKLGRTQTITFVRLSADSTSAYIVMGHDGERTASITLAADTTRLVFGAMRGEQQNTPFALTIQRLGPKWFAPSTPPRARSDELPRYPETLRARNIEGQVIMSYVVDSTGHFVPSSLWVIASTDPAFTRSATEALERTQFDPATDAGRPISMRTQMRFVFSLTQPTVYDTAYRGNSSLPHAGRSTAGSGRPFP